MAVTAVQVKELREKTNAGMLDCKKALEETQGNFEAAVEWLRVKGLSSAAKKAGRIAAEGLVYAFSTGKSGVVVEVNSETDFVSRNDAFKDFVKNIGNHVAQSPPATGDLLEQAYALNPSQKLGDVLKETISKLVKTLLFVECKNMNWPVTDLFILMCTAKVKSAYLLKPRLDRLMVQASQNSNLLSKMWLFILRP